MTLGVFDESVIQRGNMISLKHASLSWVQYLVPDRLEQDPKFREYLGRLGRIGFSVAGISVVMAIGLILLIGIVFQGIQPVWTHDPSVCEVADVADPSESEVADVVTLWDKLLIICVGCLCYLLSRTKLDVEVGRYVAWALMFAIAFIHVYDDVVVSENVDFSTGYLVMILLIGVSTLPFRPWQVTLQGITLMLVYLIEVRVYPGGLMEPVQFYRQMIPTTVLATMITCYLYQARHRLFRARQKERQMKESISRYAEELEQTYLKLRDTQDSLIHSEKLAALGNLVAGVAHEINSPLGSIGSAADTSQRALQLIATALEDGEDSWKDEKVQRAFQTLVSLNDSVAGGAERINRIVTALRNFARLDEGEFQTINVNRGIEDTLTLVLANPEVRVDVEKDLGPLPELHCRPRQLNQVFLNILNNALEAMENRGRLTIRTWEDGGYIQIRFSDDGGGIPPEDLGHVFEPGFTTKGRGVGTGLGLAICYRIVEEHGGTLGIESAPGEGATVSITLPLGPNRAEGG